MAAGRFLIRRFDNSLNDIQFESDHLTIGRLPGNELVLNHRAVDETHAGIKEVDGRYSIFNLSGNNGVLMNRILVERKELRKGDVLQAGPFLLRFMPAPGILNITVEVAAGWQIEATGPEAAAADVSEAQSFEVFWEKRKRESGKITDETVLHPRGRRRLGKAVACWMPTLDLRQPWRPAGLSGAASWRWSSG